MSNRSHAQYAFSMQSQAGLVSYHFQLKLEGPVLREGNNWHNELVEQASASAKDDHEQGDLSECSIHAH